MVMTVLKKAVAFLLIVLVVLLGDLIVIYGAKTKMSEALENSVDGALVINMDNEVMAYSNMDTLIELSRIAFNDVLKSELNLDDNFKNNAFFRHGVDIEYLYVGWYDGYPIVRAQVSAKIDTILLGRFIASQYSEVRVNNFDHLYWQWAYITQKGVKIS